MEKTNHSITEESMLDQANEELSYFVQDECEMDVHDVNDHPAADHEYMLDQANEELSYFVQDECEMDVHDVNDHPAADHEYMLDQANEELSYFVQDECEMDVHDVNDHPAADHEYMLDQAIEELSYFVQDECEMDVHDVNDHPTADHEYMLDQAIEELSYFVQDECEMDVHDVNNHTADHEVENSAEIGSPCTDVQDFCDSGGESGSSYSVHEDFCENNDEMDGHDSTMNRIAIDSVGDICSIDLKSFVPEDVAKYDFLNLNVAYLFYVHYARANGFCVRKYNVIKSRQTGEILQQEFVCNRNGKREDRGLSLDQRKREPKRDKRCGCKANFRVHIDIIIGRWYCTCFTNIHTHELYDDVECGLQAPHRKMSYSDVAQMNGMKVSGIGPGHMFRAFANQCGGPVNVSFTKQDLHNQLGRQKRMLKNDAVTAMQFLGNLKSNDDDLYCEPIIDQDGRLQHLFWSDGIGQLSYQVYGDVLAFDATYAKNKYMLPLVVFSGVNNHNRTTIFAAAIVSNETIETYVWLLEQFMIAMKGKEPKAVITDSDPAMRNAIKRIFPNAHHRLCAWHLLFNANTNIKNPLFTQEFKNCMFGDYDVGKFRTKWDEMVMKFGLQDHRWVIDTYNKRKMWATAHFRGKFFAGFRTTSRCEGLHSELGKYVHSRYNLTDFLEQYHNCLKHMRYREIEDDCKSMHGDPVLQTNLKSLERSAAKHFTNAIFLLFRRVLQHAGLVKVLDCEDVLSYSIYTVVKLTSGAKEWHVSFYPDTTEFKCSCMKMESRGLACEHIVAVLAHLRIEDLPQCLILKRWTKGAKDGVYRQYSVGKDCWDSQKTARCGALMDLYRVLGDLNSDDVDDFNYAREKANDLIEHIKAKKSCQRGDGKSFSQMDFSSLKDPIRVATKGRGVKSTSSSGVRAKRIINCSICKVPGHNKVTCPYRPQERQETEELVHEDEIDFFTLDHDVDS